MKSFAAVCIALLSAGCIASQADDCRSIDPELLACPAPLAPRITELRQGTVTVQLTIQADGSVSAARVVSASGHPACKDAVLQAVKIWRYKASDQPRTSTVPFDLKYAD